MRFEARLWRLLERKTELKSCLWRPPAGSINRATGRESTDQFRPAITATIGNTATAKEGCEPHR